MAGRGSGGLSGAHRMAASHSPHLEEGLLAQSLENHLPTFGEPSTTWHIFASSWSSCTLLLHSSSVGISFSVLQYDDL